ncbi:MAG: helix-turn-helix domain-containing protein [Candidatus Cloacimonetes bacterium]|nr:helix-turn-helix domain-containing protein [Candidatus Cloacimonadota bacterium]
MAELFRGDRSYRPDEIAEKLKVDICTVYRMIRDIDDPLPAFRPHGRALRVEGAELIRYLERRKVRPEDE